MSYMYIFWDKQDTTLIVITARDTTVIKQYLNAFQGYIGYPTRYTYKTFMGIAVWCWAIIYIQFYVLLIVIFTLDQMLWPG